MSPQIADGGQVCQNIRIQIYGSLLTGQYGLDDVYIGVPVILGANDNLDDNLDTTSEHWLSTTA